MTWADIPFRPTRKALRQFAAVWLVFFLAFGAHQYLARSHHEVGFVLMVLAVAVGIVGLLRPAAIRWLFVGWMVVAFPIGWTISQLMLVLMFYLILTPVAVLLRLRGRDPLCRKRAPDRPSYWAPKQRPLDVRSYLRQY